MNVKQDEADKKEWFAGDISSSTPLLHLQKHNRAVKRSGFCSVCRRVGSIYEGEIAKKRDE